MLSSIERKDPWRADYWKVDLAPGAARAEVAAAVGTSAVTVAGMSRVGLSRTTSVRAMDRVIEVISERQWICVDCLGSMHVS